MPSINLGFGGGPTPSPMTFSNGAAVPGAGSPPGLPLASPPGLPPGMNAQQASQIQSAVKQNPDLQGVIDTLGGWTSDAWNWISQALPHDASGSIDWGKIGSDIGGFLKNNAGAIAKGALDVLSIKNQMDRQGKSDSYAQAALKGATDAYNAKQPLRDAGMAGMLNPSANTPDLSSLKAQGQNGLSVHAPTPAPLSMAGFNNASSIASGPNAANPFAKALPLASGPGAPPMPGGPGGQNGGPSGPGAPGLPIAAPPRQSEPTPPALSMPGLPPVSYGNGATTTAITHADQNANGKFSAKQLTPNDATALMPYGPYGPTLPLAGA